jgi:hypothetical protein
MKNDVFLHVMPLRVSLALYPARHLSALVLMRPNEMRDDNTSPEDD